MSAKQGPHISQRDPEKLFELMKQIGSGSYGAVHQVRERHYIFCVCLLDSMQKQHWQNSRCILYVIVATFSPDVSSGDPRKSSLYSTVSTQCTGNAPVEVFLSRTPLGGQGLVGRTHAWISIRYPNVDRGCRDASRENSVLSNLLRSIFTSQREEFHRHTSRTKTHLST